MLRKARYEFIQTWSLAPIGINRARNQLVELAWQVWTNRSQRDELVPFLSLQEASHAALTEGENARNDTVECRSQRIDIAPEIGVLGVFELFRRSEFDGAHRLATARHA